MGTKSKSKATNESCSDSLVDEVLRNAGMKPLLSVPHEPGFVYPVSVFPPLSTFDICVNYPALVIPTRRIPEIRKRLAVLLLNRTKTKVVYELNEKDSFVQGGERANFRKMVLENRKSVFEHPLIQALFEESPGDFSRANHQITARYEDWTVEQVLLRLLPVKEVPSAFEIIGHLVHVNLRDDVLPFKHIVGKVIIDKNAPRIKTVVNKVGTIETEYRTFGMEVIAGSETEGWSHVTVREEGCQYELDFREVYWNSRLGGEHRRLVDVIQKEARSSNSDVVVADLMAGIGPFAVPLTSKGVANIHVHANDLNPSSFLYLEINAKKNRCQNLRCYNMDGRAFCHKLQDDNIEFHHVLMNLPASAPEFLDAFRGFTGTTLPRIHVHCFSTKEILEAERATIERCGKALGVPLDKEVSNVVVHLVRNVAPNKNMYCVSFDLPESVRALRRVEISRKMAKGEDEPTTKRAKL